MAADLVLLDAALRMPCKEAVTAFQEVRGHMQTTTIINYWMDE